MKQVWWDFLVWAALALAAALVAMRPKVSVALVELVVALPARKWPTPACCLASGPPSAIRR
jgi:uncharacterized protein (DUF983 family)